MKTLKLFHTMAMFFIFTFSFGQKTNILCKCEDKIKSIKYFKLMYGDFLTQVRCDGKSYFFLADNKNDSLGIFIKGQPENEAISAQAKIWGRKPHGPKYVIIFDPKYQKFYKYNLQNENITYAGKVMNTGESNGTERP